MRTTRITPSHESPPWALLPEASGAERPAGTAAYVPGTLREHLELDERPIVLIVEDDSSIAELIGDVLETAGYRSLVARNGRIALAIARRERPALVLTDLMMPEVDGVEFVRRMRASPATSDIPIVMMSSIRPDVSPSAGQDGADSAARRMRLDIARSLPHTQFARVGDEMIPFLAKPFDIDDLVEVVDAAARHPAPDLEPDGATDGDVASRVDGAC
jgi:CheY-like chemotaxis protein